MTNKFPIKIVGDKDFIEQTENALELLKRKAYGYYVFIIKYVGTIDSVAKGSGMFVREKPPRYAVGKATVDAGTLWYAGTMVHDANHSKQYQDYILLNANCRGVVPPDVYNGKKAEEECVKVQLDVLKQLGAPKRILDYVRNSISRNYWLGSYQDRSW